jgi:hypothetical protein
MPRLLEKPLQHQQHRRRLHMHGQMQRMRPLTPQQKTLALTTHPQTTPKKYVSPRKNIPSKPFRTSFHRKKPEKHPETIPTNPSSNTVAIQ